MTFISFAQNYEDVTLWRALKDVKKGVYIDVGAHHPEEGSVTKAFYDKGWRGVNVEPVKKWYQLLKKGRPGDINLNIALSEKNKTLKFFDIPGTGLSTTKPEYARQHKAVGFKVKEITVKASTLQEVCESNEIENVHFLKIDVEGAEREVLEGANFSELRPWIVLVEASRPVIIEEGKEVAEPVPTFQEWEKLLLEQKYEFVWDDGLNRYYLAEERIELKEKIAKPPSVFDDFVHINQIRMEQSITEQTKFIDELGGRIAEIDNDKAKLQEELNRTHETSHGLFIENQNLNATLSQVNFERDLFLEQQEKFSDEVKSLNITIHGLHEQRGASLSEIENLKKIQKDQSKQLMQREKKIKTLKRNKLEYKKQFSDLKLDYKELGSKYNALSAEKHSQESQLRAEKQEVLSQLQHFQRHTAHIENELKKLKGSTSWKLIRPFRSGKRRIKHDLKLLRKAIHNFFRIFAWKKKASKPKGVVKPQERTHLYSCEPKNTVDIADCEKELLPRGKRTLYYYVDHTVLCPVNTGVQRVTRNLAVNLLANGEKVVFVKWNDENKRLILVNHDDLSNLEKWQGPKLSQKEKSNYPLDDSLLYVEEDTVGSDGNWLVVPEVPHITYHSEPVTLDLIMAARKLALRTGFVFYDAIPMKREEFAAVAPIHEEYMQHLLLANLIWPISDFSGKDLKGFFSEKLHSDESSMPTISVAMLPGESTLSERSKKATEKRQKLILSVGTIEQRKNQLNLVKAFLAIKETRDEWRLVLVGNIHPEISDELNDLARSNKSIEIKGNLSDEELSNLYNAASFTVFPSLEEGFGLPILESLWHGKPCICADFGAMGEVASGGGCLQIDTSNNSDITAAIEKLINDKNLLRNLTEAAVNRRIKSWREYAEDISSSLTAESDPRASLGSIYYLVEHTTIFGHNTGIQRVVRGLAKGLLDLGYKVRPVKWDAENRRFKKPSDDELRHLALWNGPGMAEWSNDELPEKFEANDRFLIPELTVYAGAPNLRDVSDYVKKSRLKTSWIFYDAIPWKLKQFYSDHWSSQHAKYMEAISGFDQVLAISKHSRDDLKSFLHSLKSRTSDIDRRILACELPAEFPNIRRNKQVKESASKDITILSVGSVELRKNHTNLIHAFRSAHKKSSANLKLIIAGGCHLPEEHVNDFRKLVGSNKNIEWIEAADDTQLADLYEACDFTVYPSIEEGFGLPILESLWQCRPVICHHSSAMAEVAEGGGCLTTDTTDIASLGEAIVKLADSSKLRERLSTEAIARDFRTWTDYAQDVARCMANVPDPVLPLEQISGTLRANENAPSVFSNDKSQPLLSICISTYNRAGWLGVGLKNLFRLLPEESANIEIVVCDNASEDNTADVVSPYLERKDFSYYRNSVNVGMLGNLSKTANHAKGRYVWILGDDDIIRPGALERILKTIKDNSGAALIYLNYSYTREDVPSNVNDIDAFLDKGTPIVTPGPDIKSTVAACSTMNENFFTAIYCLIFRRDHAIQAYSQNTSGRPFSSLLTCIPTTYHVLHKMMHLPAVWIGEPMLVINMNVSWLKYAPLWILERFPEVYDRAETMGADPVSVDRWRLNSLPGVKHFFKDIFDNDPEDNAAYFSAQRLIRRFKHLDEFQKEIPYFLDIYRQAHLDKKPGAEMSMSDVFPAFIEQIKDEG